MHFLRAISLFTLLAGVLAQGLVTSLEFDAQETFLDPQQQTAATIPSDQPKADPGIVLDALLARIQMETAIINATLARYPDPLSDLQQKLVTAVVGLSFNRITRLIQSADEILKSIPNDDIMAGLEEADVEERELGKPLGDGKCGKVCVSKKTNSIVKEVGHAALNSILKVGLNRLGIHINPAFLALSGFVLTVNTIVGGSLVVISVLVNGIFLAIAGGIAYLGHLVSDKERQKMGGPGGPKTKEIAQMLELLGRAAAD